MNNDDLQVAGHDFDVIVVGAGPGGAYAAWRAQTGVKDTNAPSDLPDDPADRRVLLLEAGDRVGGRLESLVAPDTVLQAEFGGMGFTQHDTIFTALVDTVFNIPATTFDMPNGADLVYVRGVHLTMAEAVDPTKVPYRLTAAEQTVINGKGPGALVVWAAEKVLPGCTTFTKQQWATAKANTIFDGRHLRDLGFWNFLLMNMSNEAFNYVQDLFGHFFEIANWNCAEALPWFLQDGTASYRTLVEGYDQLPKRLVAEFEAAGGQSLSSSPVTSITKPPFQFGLDVNTGGAFPYFAKRVILAMPRRSIELLAPSSVVLNHKSLQPAIESVTGQRVMKIFLTFPAPGGKGWWNELGISSGASSTDLPIGQCWYFDPPDANSGDALMMASYNDTLATTYWQGLESGDRFPATATNIPPNWKTQTASIGMINEVLRQLREMHPGATIPTPTSAAYMDWSKDPFGGAFYTWNVGVDTAAVEATMLHPDHSVPLHVCGSAYSSDQGWAEGALATAEQVAEQHLGLERPAWLN